jgi:hypothetical protein
MPLSKNTTKNTEKNTLALFGPVSSSGPVIVAMIVSLIVPVNASGLAPLPSAR